MSYTVDDIKMEVLADRAVYYFQKGNDDAYNGFLNACFLLMLPEQYEVLFTKVNERKYVGIQ